MAAAAAAEVAEVAEAAEGRRRGKMCFNLLNSAINIIFYCNS